MGFIPASEVGEERPKSTSTSGKMKLALIFLFAIFAIGTASPRVTEAILKNIPDSIKGQVDVIPHVGMLKNILDSGLSGCPSDAPIDCGDGGCCYVGTYCCETGYCCW